MPLQKPAAKTWNLDPRLGSDTVSYKLILYESVLTTAALMLTGTHRREQLTRNPAAMLQAPVHPTRRA